MALSGTLETFSLPDVLRLLSSTKKTGLLTLEGDRGLGRVWVAEGDIVAADSDRAAGEIDGVVFDLLRFTEGSFEFDTGAEPNESDERPRAVDDALSAAETLLEEWRDIESVVPSLDVWVRLVPEIDHDVTIGAGQWRVLARVGSGASGHRIAGELEQGEFDVCRQFRDLIEQGLVEIDDESPASPERGSERGSERADGLAPFEPPAFAASTIGSAEWTPPQPLGPDAITEDPWRDEPADTAVGYDSGAGDEPVADGTPTGADAPIDDEPFVRAVRDSEDAPVDEPADDEAADIELIDDEPVSEDPAVSDGAPADDEAVAGDPDEFLTQLAHLSPKAAAAIEATSGAEARSTEADTTEADTTEAGTTEAGTTEAGTGGFAGDRFLSSLVPGRAAEDQPAAERLGEPDWADDETEQAPADEGTTDAAAADGDGDGEGDINQNLLLRFLSSTKQ